MNNHHTLRLMAITGLGTLMSLSAQAQSTSYYYGGVSAGQAQEKINATRMNNSALSPGLSTTDLRHEGHDTGYKAFLGYQFNPMVGMEFGYFNLGRFTYDATTFPAGTVKGRADIQGLNLDLVGTMPLAGKLSALGRIGVQHGQTKDRFDTGGLATVNNAFPKKREFNYKVGAGFQYEFSPAVLARAEIERYRVNDAVGNHGAVHLVSLSLVFPFGRYSEPARVSVAEPAPAPYVAPPPVVSEAPIVMEPPAAGMPPPVPPPLKRVSFEAESLFGFDKSEVMPEGQAALNEFAKEAGTANIERIKVEGHTDRIGRPAYNQHLSEERAAAVKAYLVNSAGLDGNKIATEGKGETSPVTKADDCKGHKNSARLRDCLRADRRVEIELYGTNK
jgi:OOP family OmpA-OmpF porin